MGFLKELLAKQRYPVLLLVVSFALILLGNYSISGDLTKPKLDRQKPQVLLNLLGFLSLCGSAILFSIDEDFLAYRRGCKIRNTDNGFETRFRDSILYVDFGLLQDLYQPADKDSVVVLPANEFFDERCFQDVRTAAGAFVSKYFSPDGSAALRELVHSELRNKHYEEVPVARNMHKKSYGVGTCVYVHEPLGQPGRIIFAAVATDREPYGLRTDLSTVFKAVEEVKCNLASQRSSKVFMPLLGGGKGGVPPEIAFLTLVSALLEARCREGGHNLKEVHIVVFQSGEQKPDLSRRHAKKCLRQLLLLYQEMSK